MGIQEGDIKVEDNQGKPKSDIVTPMVVEEVSSGMVAGFLKAQHPEGFVYDIPSLKDNADDQRSAQ